MALVMCYQLTRTLGLYPAIFADELIYATFARLVPLAQATIPNYLYFALFGSTNACGAGFLDCARIINVLLFVGAAPFLYAIAHRFMPPRRALIVTVMSLLLPVASFTRYFMPESLYFLAFFVLTWVALGGIRLHWAAHASVSGLILGAMTLVKVHALFLIMPLCLFAAYSCWAQGGPWRGRALASAVIVALASLTVKFGLGYLMGGPNALHLFGTFYGSHADNSATHSLATFLLPLWINGRAHLMALALLFGLPIASMLHTLATACASGKWRDPLVALQLYAVLMIGAALAMTVAYTASLADIAPREIERLHMRYYDYAFPLLLIGAGAALGSARRRLPLLAWSVALLLAAGIGFALVWLPSYALMLTDGPDIAALFMVDFGLPLLPGYARFIAGRPEMAALFVASHMPLALAALQLAALGLWAYGKPVAWPMFLFVFFPLLLIAQNSTLHTLAGRSAAPSAFDRAGQYVHDHVPKSEHKDVAIAGHGLAHLMRAKFHIDDPQVSFIELAPDAPFDMDKLPLRRKWLLLMAPHTLPPALTAQVVTPDFALVKIQATHESIASAVFSQLPNGGLIAAIEGVDQVEPWGRWSIAKRVTIKFSQRLPQKVNLMLKGQSYGPNATQDYAMHIGAQTQRFRIGHAVTEVYLRFDTDGLQDSVTIDVPQPASPQQLEGAHDARTLGLGLIEIEVGQRR